MPQHRITTIVKGLFTFSLALVAPPSLRVSAESSRELVGDTPLGLTRSPARVLAAESKITISSPPFFDEAFFKPYILAKSPDLIEKIVKLIIRMRQFDPVFKNYFDLVFTHMPNFKIEIVPLKQLKQLH